VLTVDQQHRLGDGANALEQIHVPDRSGTAGVAIEVDRHEGTAHTAADFRMLRSELGCEETLHHGRRDRRHALAAQRLDARGPGGRIHLGGGAGEHQSREPLGCAQRQAHRHHAAQRQAAHQRLGYPGRIHDRERILGQLLDAVLTRRSIGGAVAQQIHAQYTELREQRRPHRIP
jgi:hypothetical protein